MISLYLLFGFFILTGPTSSSSSSSSPGDFVCPDEFGYYPHPTDCRLYYVCVFGGSLLESCSGGLMYSNELQTCDWPRNVECAAGQSQKKGNITTESKVKSNGGNDVEIPSAIDEFPQQRLSRSYAGAQPNFKNYEAPVPLGRRVIRQLFYYGYGGGYPTTQKDTGHGHGHYYEGRSQQQQVYDNNNGGNDYYYDDETPNSTPTMTTSGHLKHVSSSSNYHIQPTTNSITHKSISSKLVHIQEPTAQTQDEYDDASDYISQRYAANVSNKVEQQQTQIQQPQQQQQQASKDYEYYYDYEDPQQQQIVVATTTTTTTQKPYTIRHHVTQQPQPPPRRRPGAKPTLLPPSKQIIKGASTKVRNIFVDPPSRPDPVYATPEPNSAAKKCHRDTCVIPDCNCGGKDNPGGLDPSNTPQLVILTFDDSVNDLNKNLYKDLFEVGRKNPNGCPISATFYVSHEWTDYSQVQNLAADGHEIASHSVSHSFGEQFSSSKWAKEINGQREILSAYGGVKLNSVRGMRAPFLAIGGNNMFKMLYDTNFTYDSSMPVYENKPPSWPYTLDYKIFHDCMIPPCPTKSFPGVWEVPMVMWTDLKGGRCSMGDACSNPPTAQGVYEMLVKNFERHYTTNRAPFGLYYHAAWFTQPHHKEGFESFLDVLVSMEDVWLVTNWQAIQWTRDPVGINEGVINYPPFDCNSPEYKSNIPKKCTNPRVCNLWHKSGVRYLKTCQNCPEVYPWTGSTGV